MTQRGLVVMAYGTPAAADQVAEYYTHIRHGRPPSDEQLKDLQRRYDAIGGLSPLAERTREQVGALTDGLEAREPGTWRVELGNKHAAPFVEDAVNALLTDDDVEQVVGLVLAPHWSRASVGEYHRRAGAVIVEANRGIVYSGIESWHDLPAWVDLQASRVRSGLADLPDATKVLFTAHSLPERVLDRDPYPDQLRASALAIATGAGLDPWADWALAWQSAGRTPEPWRGPDVLEVIRNLAATERAEGVLVCPQGFVSDHLEVLYDLDVDAARVAEEVGLAFARTPSINDDASVMEALAERIVGICAAGNWARPRSTTS